MIGSRQKFLKIGKKFQSSSVLHGFDINLGFQKACRTNRFSFAETFKQKFLWLQTKYLVQNNWSVFVSAGPM